MHNGPDLFSSLVSLSFWEPLQWSEFPSHLVGGFVASWPVQAELLNLTRWVWTSHRRPYGLADSPLTFAPTPTTHGIPLLSSTPSQPTTPRWRPVLCSSEYPLPFLCSYKYRALCQYVTALHARWEQGPPPLPIYRPPGGLSDPVWSNHNLRITTKGGQCVWLWRVV